MPKLPVGEPIRIFLVEDNDADVRLTREALADAKIRNELRVARDGVEALEMLRADDAATRPHLILLDLNLPRLDGREVLEEIKADPVLRRIPVVILTSSEAEIDIARAYDLHANSYVTKPVDLQQFFQVVNSIEDFWLTVVRFSSVPDDDGS